MRAEKAYHYVGRYGIAFDISEFIIQPGQCCDLPKLSLPSVHGAHYKVTIKARELYDRMLPGKLPCHIKILVSRPLTREQADQLNENRITVPALVSAAISAATGAGVAGAFGKLAGKIAGGTTGAAATIAIRNQLPTFHSSDVLVSLEAQVKGGIGPQVSALTLIL
ncbi:hypothetical protein HU734_012500 [Pseudomonas wayambapalatensis]|nr:hypothetical protein HU734_012500 [Pseudomonas wayambapalatensis]